LDILNEDTSDFVSLFEMKRLKGWWPCVNVEGGDPELTVRWILMFRRDNYIFCREKLKLNLRF
jgi:hypothetical protein